MNGYVNVTTVDIHIDKNKKFQAFPEYSIITPSFHDQLDTVVLLRESIKASPKFQFYWRQKMTFPLREEVTNLYFKFNVSKRYMFEKF
jgi:hypothetical protein